MTKQTLERIESEAYRMLPMIAGVIEQVTFLIFVNEVLKIVEEELDGNEATPARLS